ncbi:MULTISPECIES: NAD kinase [Falsihalocynthiibacter]|uniref:NAD kinase n=1 Tax=Falsihalocynthiibacter arcticus TaxID=1579316 RepID=A0A126UVY7_9RHOB|nr:NAD kinase [Falsihalocynthiibacter arcticus]AML50233.1 NAD(+) kinase [Falsihalocynthiibacter arcticus]
MSARIHFKANGTDISQAALARFQAQFGDAPEEDCDVIVVFGGDGMMLQTLHSTQHLNTPVFGMNCGTVGFLTNKYSDDNLEERLRQVEEEILNPLRMHSVSTEGVEHDQLAINEVSLLRAGPQAAKLRITVDGHVRLSELICDGALVSTPAGSTAYNYSAHGPILPIGSDVLALTPMAAFRPRRWRGALLPKAAKVRFDVLEPEKRPVMVAADSRSEQDVLSVEIYSDPTIEHRILFDEGHGLKERLLREQFV